MELVDHRIVPHHSFSEMVRYAERPIFNKKGEVVSDLHSVWITLNNPKDLNSYTTEMVKEVIMAFDHAGADRRNIATVFTGEGEKSFCTGGNTKEYAEYYSGRPLEYAQYMWLFNMMVNSILLHQKPVICRVNGMRIAGGQEIGMACDFTIAGDHATFGQAGPRHGSAPVGGSTDFLPAFVGVERAMNSAVLCKSWDACEAALFGLITEYVPVYKKNGDFIASPFLSKPYKEAKAEVKECEMDLSCLDKKVNNHITQLLHLMSGCVMKTVFEVRRAKWEQWARNFPSHRDWLALNMLSDAKAGFNAFNLGNKEVGREVDFILLHKLQANGHKYDERLINAILQEGIELPD